MGWVVGCELSVIVSGIEFPGEAPPTYHDVVNITEIGDESVFVSAIDIQ